MCLCTTKTRMIVSQLKLLQPAYKSAHLDFYMKQLALLQIRNFFYHATLPSGTLL